MPYCTDDPTSAAVAADFLLRDYLRLKAGECVVLTADMSSDSRAVMAVADAARVLGGRVAVLTMPRLPFQGKLADPYIPAPVVAALEQSDVWVDFTFPYLSGSDAHARVLKAGRARSINILDLGLGGLARLFAQADFDRLFALQTGLDALVAAAEGQSCRMTNDAGTDVRFVLAQQKPGKRRHQDVPGTTAPPGSVVILPVPSSVRGVVVVHAVFHEWYTTLRTPMRIEVDGAIRGVTGGDEEADVFKRSLRRAGQGELGSIIHFSHGFHPAARFTGRSFNEDIRVRGNDAIGFGTPWWEPGGGENHPDAVCVRHSLWIGDLQVIDHGAIVGPAELAALDRALLPRYL
jgi:2,5-dihydroxypyridine 5,6-dioxygenase